MYGNNLSTSTMGTTGMGINTHILGNRHYELTNHLGNVQATVVDRTTPVVNPTDGELEGYNADISTAQDYYPFGMYMPGRYLSDTDRHCVTVNSTIMVAKPVKLIAAKAQTIGLAYQVGADPAPPEIGNLPKATAFEDEVLHVYHYNSAELHPHGWVIHTDAAEGTVQYEIDLSDEPGEMYAYFQIHADTNQEVQPFGFNIELADGVLADMRVRQYYGGEEDYYELTEWTELTIGDHEVLLPINKSAVAAGGNTILEILFKSHDAQPFANGLKAILHNPYTFKTQMVPTNFVTTICDDEDDYRFGFNGQEKDNEVKGVGNSTTYEYRVYDSRLGKFLSRDPLFRKYSEMSPYSFSYNSPIYFRDNDGRYIEGVDKNLTGGKAYHIFGTSIWINASDETKRIGNAIIKTETGRKMMDAAMKTSYPIGLHIEETVDSPPTKFGRTPTKGYFNKDGTFTVTRADVYVKTGNMVEWAKVSDPENVAKYAEQMKENLRTQPAGESRQGMQYFLLINTGRLEDAVGATGSHELEHATNPENIRAVHEYGEKGKKGNYEQDVEGTTNEIEQKDLDERTKQDIRSENPKTSNN